MLTRLAVNADHSAIDDVNRAAFGRPDEARLVAALRVGGFATVELVAIDQGTVSGHILFSPLTVVTSGPEIHALALAPMAVIPSRQRQGIGSALVRHGLEACRQSGHTAVVVLGHIGFYSRLGFSSRLAETLDCPFHNGPELMAIELQAGALARVQGQLLYAPPFLQGPS